MPKISKSKNADVKSSQKFTDPVISSLEVQQCAWETTHGDEQPLPKEKSSKFPKLWNKNKKSRDTVVEKIDRVEMNAVVYHAFEKNDGRKTPRSTKEEKKGERNLKFFKKSFSDSTFLPEKDDDYDEEILNPSTIRQSDTQINSENSKVIITVLSSDSSDSENINNVQKQSKKSKNKISKNSLPKESKEKKSKIDIEISNVVFLQKDERNKSCNEILDEIPWNSVKYDPDLNQDKIIDKKITATQLINLLGHENFKNETVLIDLRSYDKYCDLSILGAMHFSDFQNNDGKFSIEKVVKRYKIIVFILSKESNIDFATEAEVQIFTVKNGLKHFKDAFVCFLNSKMNSRSNSWPPMTCFENGHIIFCEDFSKNIKWISKLQSDIIVTNSSDCVRGEISQCPIEKSPMIISTKMTEIYLSEYSEKKLADSELMKICKNLFSEMNEDTKCVIIFTENNNGLSLCMLVLCLMMKNHWALSDALYCVEFVRCQECNLKPNYLTVLKSFEKLFFGKRLFSASSKNKSNQDFAVFI